MENFIIITLLFFDNNINNIYDNGDKLIEFNKPGIERNVYCELPNSDKKELCGYSSKENKTLGLDDEFISSLKNKHYTFNSEVFEKGFISGRGLYVEVIGSDYLFKYKESEVNKDNVIYSLSNDDSIYIDDIKKDILYGFITLVGILVLILILFPKKKSK